MSITNARRIGDEIVSASVDISVSFEDFEYRILIPNPANSSGDVSTDVGFIDGKPYICFTDHASDCTYTASA